MREKSTGRPNAALSSVLEVLGKQIGGLELAASAFQQAQRMLPLPSAAELSEMRKGARPVSRTVYLLWLLQRALMALEEIANGLGVEIEDGLAETPINGFSPIQFNAVEQAILYVREAGPLKECGFRRKRPPVPIEGDHPVGAKRRAAAHVS